MTPVTDVAQVESLAVLGIPEAQRDDEVSSVRKLCFCALLFFFSVTATLFTSLSKNDEGDYSYNTVVIPCSVEAIKFFSSAVALRFSKSRGAAISNM